MTHTIGTYLRVALSFAGSAILLFACREQEPAPDAAVDEALMTEYCEHITIVESQNGRRSYRFSAPLVEGYAQAREPYREFRKGIKITTYRDDSLSSVDIVLTANYAIYYENRKLWEAKGNVVVEKFDGKKLYTQQLFWNALTKKVYSNVDTRIESNGGRDFSVATGFETDEEFNDWRYRYSKGRIEVDVTPRSEQDSTGVQPASDSLSLREAPRRPADGRPRERIRLPKNRRQAGLRPEWVVQRADSPQKTDK